MASGFPGFITRLIRPFNSSTRLGLNPEGLKSEKFPAPSMMPPGSEQAVVAAGCFWGVEHAYRKYFTDGLYDARVGYMGGDVTRPEYRNVCSGTTGHAESLRIIYDPSKITYRSLIEFFYKMHDPTTANSQGADTGPQYRSAIFFFDDEQEKIARDVTEKANKLWWKGKIVTQIMPAGEWWDGEISHQEYLEKNPFGYQCPTHFVRKNLEPLE